MPLPSEVRVWLWMKTRQATGYDWCTELPTVLWQWRLGSKTDTQPQKLDPLIRRGSIFRIGDEPTGNQLKDGIITTRGPLRSVHTQTKKMAWCFSAHINTIRLCQAGRLGNRLRLSSSKARCHSGVKTAKKINGRQMISTTNGHSITTIITKQCHTTNGGINCVTQTKTYICTAVNERYHINRDKKKDKTINRPALESCERYWSTLQRETASDFSWIFNVLLRYLVLVKSFGRSFKQKVKWFRFKIKAKD